MLESGHFVSVFELDAVCAPVDKTLLYLFFGKVYTEYLVSTNIPPTNLLRYVYLSLEMD